MCFDAFKAYSSLDYFIYSIQMLVHAKKLKRSRFNMFITKAINDLTYYYNSNMHVLFSQSTLAEVT